MKYSNSFVCLLFILLAMFTFSNPVSPTSTNSHRNMENNIMSIAVDTTQYPSQGRINDFTASLPENDGQKLFQTTFSSFDNYWLRYNWQDALGGASGYSICYPDSYSVPFKPTWFSDHGVHLSVKTFGAAYNPFDIYYNTTYHAEIIATQFQKLNTITWIPYTDEIIIGDEAPATLFQWFGFGGSTWPERILKYNNTCFAETGVYMRTEYSNQTERWLFDNWLVNRTMSAMNLIYDDFKAIYPSKSIGWATMPWPGFEPTLLKSDFRCGGYYTTNFREYYAMIRQAKLIDPVVDVDSVIMGDDDPTNPQCMSFALQEQFFWIDYFAGGDSVQWFDAANNQHWDTIGDEHAFERYQFHCGLNKLANALPVLTVKPRVLNIDKLRGTVSASAVGFRECDSATQLQVVQDDFVLSQYDVIIIDNQFLAMDALVRKLSTYVNNGGNLILRGPLQVVDEPRNASGLLPQYCLPLANGTNLIKESRYTPCLLDLEDDYLHTIAPSIEVSQRAVLNFTSSANWHAIKTGVPEEAQGLWPIAIFHNNSLPNSGQILFYGMDAELDDDLYINLVDNFVNQLLGISDITCPPDHPNMLISTAVDDNNRTIVGLIPDTTEGQVTVEVNVTRRNLPPLNQWMYRGFKELTWFGDAGGPIYPGNQGTSLFRADVTQYKPQRWVLTPQSPKPLVQVYAHYPKVNPYTGETIPISLSVYEALQYVNLESFEIELALPSGLTLASLSQPLQQTCSSLQAVHNWRFYWLLNASAPDLYTIGIRITSPTLAESLNYSLSLRVFSGRLELSCPNISYQTVSEPVQFQGTITYYGDEPRVISIEDCIQDYIWGNPGGFCENITLNSGESYTFSYQSSASGYRIGETAVFHIFVIAYDGMIWSEDYFQITILPAQLAVSSLVVVNNTALLNVSCVGNDYVYNIYVTLQSDEISISDESKYLGTLSPGSLVTVSWIIPAKSHAITLCALISAADMVTIQRTAFIPYNSTPIIISNTTVIDNTTTINNTTVINNTTIIDNTTTVNNTIVIDNTTIIDNTTVINNTTTVDNVTMIDNTTVIVNNYTTTVQIPPQTSLTKNTSGFQWEYMVITSIGIIIWLKWRRKVTPL